MDAATEQGLGQSPLAPGGGSVVGTTAPITAAAPEKVEKVIVAVHGIGDQYSFATIQAVVNQFCSFYGQPAAVPLGNFHGSDAYSIPPPYPRETFGRLAFAEVYWAPIPRDLANQKYTLEEAKKWARTVVERLRLRWRMEGSRDVCSEEDFRLTQQVLGEMIQTIAVLDRLCFLADKAGLFTFDLKKLLDDYLGDVQIVAEFKDQRDKILDAFAGLLERVAKAFPEAEIYLVAHSEGTVVSFLGLLKAFRQPEPPAWTGNVRGLMTLGSPIDKHLALWPELFDDGPPQQDAAPRIEWRNYYDFGDPVGFELDAVREWLAVNRWQGVFHFEDEHDIGFTRYPFPGKAHVDYWTDEGVFGHFISTVVEAEPLAAAAEPAASAHVPAAPIKPKEVKPKPADVRSKQWLSYVVPYAGVLALLFLAAYVLTKAVLTALSPLDEAGRPVEVPNGLLFQSVAGLAALLAGVTLVARIPRLTRSGFWRTLSLVLAGLAAAVYLWSVGDREEAHPFGIALPPGAITLGLAVLLVLAVFAVSVKRPGWGLTPLMVLGTAVVVGLVASHLQARTGPVWPVFLATAAFLYLWWLAALLFDLVFIWHLYIRHSKLMWRVNEVLGTYKERKRAPERPAAAPLASART